MSAALTTTDPVRIMLLAPAKAPIVPMAAAVLARHLNLSYDQALARLHRSPAALAGGLSRDRASRLATLLSVLGLRLRSEPDIEAAPRRVDVSVQAVSGVDPVTVVRDLAEALRRPVADVLRDLHQSGGVILRGCSPAEAEALRCTLRKTRGLRISTCCPDAAVFDLFAPPGALPDRPLLRHLAVMGLAPCWFSGALASGLTRTLRDHLTARFPRRVFALERAFQRLDLYLTGSGTLTPLDLADFLATRRLEGGRLDMIAPVRLETGLSYAAARQFHADYDMIGLPTIARLSPSGQTRKNP